MIRRFGPRPPWNGKYRAHGRVLYWVAVEPTWDGTTVWELRDVPIPTLMRQLYPSAFLMQKVSWLEDCESGRSRRGGGSSRET